MDRTVSVLRKRAEFLAAAASGFKFVKPSLVVQSRPRAANELASSPIRVGFTATKKLGNAVVRNRVKRRMRAAAAELAPRLGLNGCDYVFIGREAAFKGTYDDLIRDMKHALKRLADIMRKTESVDNATHEPPCPSPR